MSDHGGCPRDEITGVILAGGRALRMGGVDKGLVPVNGRPMVAYVVDALRPQTGAIVINANRSHDVYSEYGYPVVADRDGDFRGPLAGMASGMRAADTRFVLSVPCDSPLVCANLAERLYAAAVTQGMSIAVAHDGHRLQPVFALISRSLLADMEAYLDGGGRKIDRWYETHGFATVDLGDVPETFLNINEPADKLALEKRLANTASMET